MAAVQGLRLLVAVVLLVLVTPRHSPACSCVPDVPLCESFWNSDAVFEGEVQEIETPARKQRLDPFAGRRVRFTVDRVWHGEVAGSVDVMTGSGGGDCGYSFRKGRKYLVYASEREGRLMTNICSPTKPVDRAAADREYLSTARATNARGRIFGVVRGSDRRPAPRYTVVLEGGGEQRTTVTNANGEYEFSPVPQGSSTVRVVVHEGERAFGREDVSLLDARACARRDFTIETPR